MSHVVWLSKILIFKNMWSFWLQLSCWRRQKGKWLGWVTPARQSLVHKVFNLECHTAIPGTIQHGSIGVVVLDKSCISFLCLCVKCNHSDEENKRNTLDKGVINNMPILTVTVGWFDKMCYCTTPSLLPHMQQLFFFFFKKQWISKRDAGFIKQLEK